MRFKNEAGFHEINSFHGCNQLAIFNHAFVRKAFRSRGLGDKMHKQRLAQAVDLGYDYVLCTCVKDNLHQTSILIQNGWSILAYFYNTETERDIVLFGKHLELGESK